MKKYLLAATIFAALAAPSPCIGKAYEDRLVTFGDGDINLSDFCQRHHQHDIDCQHE